MNYSQTFAWKPKAKERPRAQPGGKGRSYTPKATRDAEKALADQYKGPKFEGPIEVSIKMTNTEVHLAITECDDYANRQLRGDIDNLYKLCSDALNGIAWVDDRQIVRVVAAKL